MLKELEKMSIIDRVTKMESYLDSIRAAFDDAPMSVYENHEINEMLNVLIEYYESGLWLADYTRDENGELPADLKRGVLSEDAVYNLLCDIENYDVD